MHFGTLPIVSAVRPEHIVPGGIGTLVRSVNGAVVDLEAGSALRAFL
jgi:hypothetical protein